MKKVLLIGFLWPYLGGSKRVIGLANHLEEFSWQPNILTAPLQKRPPDHLRIIQTGYRGILGRGARLLGLDEKAPVGEQVKERIRGLSPGSMAILRWGSDMFREVYAYPDEHKGWIPYALSSADEFIRREKCDALLSIWPYSSHLIAQELKKRHGLPWIADLADLWSDNSAYPYGRIRKWFDTRLEKRTLGDADTLMTSSGPLAERLAWIHPQKKIGVNIIGFDPDIMNTPPKSLGKQFTIIYTGVFYWKKRDPYPFFKALSELRAENKVQPGDLEVHVYGPDQGWVQQEIRELSVGEIVKQFPSIPYQDCIEKQRESHVLLQLNWNDVNERGVFSGKLLDYLAAGRPILAAGGSGNDDVVIEILRKTGAGVYAVSVEEIKAAILRFIEEYRKTGTLVYRGKWEEVEKYSNREMAKTFARNLNLILGN